MGCGASAHPIDPSWPEVHELVQVVEDRPEFKYPGGLAQLAERLGTDIEKGLPPDMDEKARIKHFGLNFITSGDKAIDKALRINGGNHRFLVRGGENMSLPDEKIVVGDIVLFNSHNASEIFADCILVSGDGVKTGGGALGELEKDLEKDPFMISGTTVNAGSGKMLVIAVGKNSVRGKA